MIQDIAPRTFDNRYRAASPRGEDAVMLFFGHSMLVCPLEAANDFVFPTFAQFTAVFQDDYDYRYAFAIDGVGYYLALPADPALRDRPKSEAPAGMVIVPIAAFRKNSLRHVGHAAQTGWQLHGWYSRNLWCGRCAGRMEHAHDERVLVCPICGNHVHPLIMPAVIIAVTDGDKLLMTRYSRGAYRARALVAGFCEIGETAEETVAREVFEETGLRVNNIRYYKSQPWGFAGDLLLGYVCDLDGSPEVRLGDDELATAEWIARGDIEERDDGVSLTREMITRFKEGLL